MRLYQEIFEAWRWSAQVRESFRELAEERRERAIAMLPSGSGFDSGTSVDEVSERRMILSSSFHKMNEIGSYVGWDEFRIIVKPAFDGFSIGLVSTSGRIRPEDRGYYLESFFEALNQEVERYSAKRALRRFCK